MPAVVPPIYLGAAYIFFRVRRTSIGFQMPCGLTSTNIAHLGFGSYIQLDPREHQHTPHIQR